MNKLDTYCVGCGITEVKRPIWMLVEYQYGIGVCYDCSNATNKQKFFDEKKRIIASGALVSDKQAVTKLRPDEIFPSIAREELKKEKQQKFNNDLIRKKIKEDKVEARRLKKEQKENEKAEKNRNRIANMEARRNEELRLKEEKGKNRILNKVTKPASSNHIADTSKMVKKIAEVKPETLTINQKSKPMTNTKIIWVVANKDPEASDLASIKLFVDHFGTEDIDIKMNSMRVILKNEYEVPSGTAAIESKVPAHHSPAKYSKKGTKIGKDKFPRVNNTSFPDTAGTRQPMLRCTGCGSYKKIFTPDQKWIETNGKLCIGLCNHCNTDADKVDEYIDTVSRLEGGGSAAVKQVSNESAADGILSEIIKQKDANTDENDITANNIVDINTGDELTLDESEEPASFTS